MNLITLTICDNAFEAHNLKNRLEAEGIQAFIFDENLISLNPLYSQAIGGIKVKIAEEDLELAEKVIHAIQADDFNVSDEEDTISCPSCNSTAINSDIKDFKNLPGLLALAFSFIFFVYPIYWRKRSQCENCGLIFQKK